MLFSLKQEAPASVGGGYVHQKVQQVFITHGFYPLADWYFLGRYFPHDGARPKTRSQEVNNGAVLPLSSSRYFPYDRVRPKLWSQEVNNGAVLSVSSGKYFPMTVLVKGC